MYEWRYLTHTTHTVISMHPSFVAYFRGHACDATSLKQHQSRLVTTLLCLVTSFTEHVKKYGAYFTALWAQSSLEQPDLVQINDRHRTAADRMWRWAKRKWAEEKKQRKGNIFNLPLCSLTFTVLIYCAHTLILQIQLQGFDGHRQREWSFYSHGEQSL